MNVKTKASFLLIPIILVIVLGTIHIDEATAKVDIKQYVEKFSKIANNNIDSQGEIKNLKKSLDKELKKESVNSSTIASTKEKIDKLERNVINNVKELKEIQKLVKKEIHMKPELLAKLEIAREILRDNRDKIPYSGLGMSHIEKTVIIAIYDEDPESYRALIEELVGSDVPVKIKMGTANPFMSCDNKNTACNPLIGGLEITGDTNTCTLTFPVTRDGEVGFLTAGHCFKEGELIYQPDDTSGEPIGIVTKSIFDENCDCAFIKLTNPDILTEDKIFYEITNSRIIWNLPLTSKITPSLGDFVTMTGSQSTYSTWGLIDDLNWTCERNWGQAPIEGLYRAFRAHIEDGDSGAPVSDPGYLELVFYGTAICHDGLGGERDDMVFIPWNRISTHLGVS